jgi:hypothetical protein
MGTATMDRTITRSNIDEMLNTGRIETAMRNGNWWRIRRNGATKRWKTDASRIRVPFKAGLKVYGAITEADFVGELLDGTYYRVRD